MMAVRPSGDSEVTEITVSQEIRSNGDATAFNVTQTRMPPPDASFVFVFPFLL
jgi:hypothetical protein